MQFKNAFEQASKQINKYKHKQRFGKKINTCVSREPDVIAEKKEEVCVAEQTDGIYLFVKLFCA